MIKKIFLTEGVSVVTIQNAPADIDCLHRIFDAAAKANINVDMISQTAPKGNTINITFTVTESKIKDLLSVVKGIEKSSKGIKTLISIGNTKISLYNEDMPSKIGVAADVFKHFKEKNIELLLVTTSDVDISVAIKSADADLAYSTLKEAYGIE